MSWILLTNDDGADSPALAPMAAALASLGEVRVVVPSQERSWVGKAITRFEEIVVRAANPGGTPMWTCSGYPADAVQVAVYALFDTRPDLIVSGINLGYNHGAGYLWSSGTVGAAIEGWIAGIPSIALSTGTMTDWSEWRRRALSRSARPDWERLAALSVDLIERCRAVDLWAHADVVSVNMPFDAGDTTPVRMTGVARVGYDRLFEGDGTRFRHEFGGHLRTYGSLDGTDVGAANRGEVSVTPIRMPESPAVPVELTQHIEER